MSYGHTGQKKATIKQKRWLLMSVMNDYILWDVVETNETFFK